MRKFGTDINTTVASSSRQFDVLGKVGLAMGAAFVAGAGLSIKAAVEFESAFTGVTKTVDGTEVQLGQLRDGIRAMAREMPASAKEIAGVAEAAGALGVRTEDILGFTKVMVNLGETTNLSSDQAATSLARFMNIMGTASGDVDRLGATLVDLGNNGASTEAEIMELGLRLAGAGKQAGLSESEVLGFANALSSMGIEAEAGGTAFSRVFIKINDAVIDGGEQLDLFADVAGMSAEEFRVAYEDDAAGAIVSFVEGLGGMQDAGMSTTGVLNDLELGEIRVSDALRRTAGNADLLRGSLDTGARAWKENTALTEEAEKRLQTTAAQLGILRNNVVDVAIGFGEKMLPAVRALASGSKELLQGFQAMPGPMQAVVVATGSLVGLVGGAAGTFLVFGDRIRSGIEAMRAFAEAFPRLSGSIGMVSAALTGAAIGIGLLAVSMGRAKAEAEALVVELQKDIEMSNYDSFTAGLERVRAKMDEINEALPTSNFGMFTQAVKGTVEILTPMENTVIDNVEAMKALRAAEEELIVAQVKMDENSHQLMNTLGLTREEVEALAQKAGVDLAGGFNDVVPALTATYQEMTAGISTSERTVLSLEDQEEAAKVLKETYKELGGVFGEMVNASTAYDTVLAASEESARAWAEAQAESTEDASDSWEDYATESKVSIQALGTELENQIAAYDAFYTNLMIISSRGREDVARELAAMGAKGAEVAADLVKASDEDFNKFGDTLVEASAKNMDAAGQNVDTGLKIMAEIFRQGAGASVASVTEALSGLPGITEEIVRDTAARANVELKTAEPAWHEGWLNRSTSGITEMGRLLAEGPPIAQEALATLNRYARDNEPEWYLSMSNRRGISVEEMNRIFNEAPPHVQAAMSEINQIAVDTKPAYDDQMTGRYNVTMENLRAIARDGPPEIQTAASEVNRYLRDHEPEFYAQMDSRSGKSAEEMQRIYDDAPPKVQEAMDAVNNAANAEQEGWRQEQDFRFNYAMGQARALNEQMPPVMRSVTDGMSNTMAAGRPRFRGEVEGYQTILVNGVRAIFLSANGQGGLNGIQVGNAADGGIFEFYAQGGMKEKHEAQIARAGDWRVWAEPETGGEAYIPLSVAKRARSTDILEDVAGRFGLVVRPAREKEVLDYHSGGLHEGCQHFHSGGVYNPPRAPSLPSFGPPIRPAGEQTTHSSEHYVRDVVARHMQEPHHQAPPPGSGMTGGAGGGGRALDRVRAAMADNPGLRITSTYRSPSQNAAVGGARNSLHMDRANPAVDIGGPTAGLDRFHSELRGMGGWRELLWRVRGHYDHIHAADQGAIFDSVRSYDQGGFLPPGVTLAYNGTGMPERILTMAEGGLMGDTYYGDPGGYRKRERRLDDDEGAQFDYARNRRERRFYAHERLDAPSKQDQSSMGRELVGVGAGRDMAAVMPVPTSVSTDNSVNLTFSGPAVKVDVRAMVGADAGQLRDQVLSAVNESFGAWSQSLWTEIRTRRG